MLNKLGLVRVPTASAQSSNSSSSRHHSTMQNAYDTKESSSRSNPPATPISSPDKGLASASGYYKRLAGALVVGKGNSMAAAAADISSSLVASMQHVLRANIFITDVAITTAAAASTTRLCKVPVLTLAVAELLLWAYIPLLPVLVLMAVMVETGDHLVSSTAGCWRSMLMIITSAATTACCAAMQGHKVEV